MDPERDTPSLPAVVEVAIGNAIPVVGVVFLGWSAFQVVVLYVLDGWFCILGLGASVMLKGREELRALIPKTYGPVRRFLAWVASIAVVEAIISLFALIPGIVVLAHMEDNLGAVIIASFASLSALAPVAMLVVSHVLRVARGTRTVGSPERTGDGVMSLDPKAQMALFAGRMGLMMWLAWLAGSGFLSRFLVPVYVTFVAVLFTYTDLYPRRFLRRVMRVREDGSDLDDAQATVTQRRPKPKLPR